MTESSRVSADMPSKLVGITRFLSGTLILFAVASIWINPLLQHKFKRVPSLVPEPLGAQWFVSLILVGMLAVLLVTAQVLVLRARNLSQLRKWHTGILSAGALLLCTLWVFVTLEGSSPRSILTWHRQHTVTLRWEASKSSVDGYNVYRSLSPAGAFEKINKDLVRELSFVDHNVLSKNKYYYVTRAVDRGGRESVDSNIATADVP